MAQLSVSSERFVEYYQKNLRGDLFAGFLSVGGFLLSLKTFVVIKLKENVYDHDSYKKIFSQNKLLDSSLEQYAPLQRLSEFLFWSVLSSISAAAAQLTLGLVDNFACVVIAISAAVFALSILFTSLLLIKSCLDDYFEFINSG